MNKEKLMQMISDAIDNGADITVHVPQFKKTQKWEPVTKEEVEHKAIEMSQLLNREIEQRNSEHAHAFTVDNGQYRFVYSYIPFMEEDVQLDGMGSEEIA